MTLYIISILHRIINYFQTHSFHVAQFTHSNSTHECFYILFKQYVLFWTKFSVNNHFVYNMLHIYRVFVSFSRFLLERHVYQRVQRLSCISSFHRLLKVAIFSNNFFKQLKFVIWSAQSFDWCLFMLVKCSSFFKIVLLVFSSI